MINWDALGAIGEIVGALAVVLTIFYLSTQVKQNTAQSERVENQDFLNRWSDLSRMMVTDENLMSLWLKGLKDHQSLSEEDWAKFKILYTDLTGWLSSHWQNRDRLTEDSGAAIFTEYHAYWRVQPSGEYWWKLLSDNFPQDFCREVDRKTLQLKQGKALELPASAVWISRGAIEALKQDAISGISRQTDDS
jgi:hypothetical protein